MKNKIALLFVFFGIIGFSLSASAANIPSDVCETEFESGYVEIDGIKFFEVKNVTGSLVLSMPFKN